MAQKSHMRLLHVPLQNYGLAWRAMVSLFEQDKAYFHTCLRSTVEADCLPTVRNYWRCCLGPCGCQRAHGGPHLSRHATCHSSRSSLSLHPQLCPDSSESKIVQELFCTQQRVKGSTHAHAHRSSTVNHLLYPLASSTTCSRARESACYRILSGSMPLLPGRSKPGQTDIIRTQVQSQNALITGVLTLGRGVPFGSEMWVTCACRTTLQPSSTSPLHLRNACKPSKSDHFSCNCHCHGSQDAQTEAVN